MSKERTITFFLTLFYTPTPKGENEIHHFEKASKLSCQPIKNNGN